MKAFNGLTASEDERLSLLAEECAEVIQMVAKIQRHGFASYHPHDRLREANRNLLEREIGHVYHAVDLLTLKDLSARNIELSAETKAQSIRQYLHHQTDSSPALPDTQEP